jgi:hypothetical protein
MVKEREPGDIKHNDEVSICAPPSDEAIHEPIPPTQEEEYEVSHFPFQVSEPLNKTEPPSYKVGDVEAILPFDEVIQILESPTQEEVIKVSCFPFQNFNDSLSYDVESEKVLDVFTPSRYNEDDDFVDNIEELIHVGKRNWDVIGYDGDPIYDIEGHVQKLPLPLSHEVTNFDNWQQRDGMITNLFQTPKDDLVLYYPSEFQSYLEDFYDYPSKNLDLFHE